MVWTYIYIYISGIYTAGGEELRTSLIPIGEGARRSKKEQREKQDERKEEQKDCWMKAYVQKTALPIFGRQGPKVWFKGKLVVHPPPSFPKGFPAL